MGWWGDVTDWAGENLPIVGSVLGALGPTKDAVSEETRKRLEDLSTGAGGLSTEFLDQLKGMGPSFAPVMQAASVGPAQTSQVQTVDQTVVAPNERMQAASAGTATNVARTAVAPVAQVGPITLDPTVRVDPTKVGPAAQAQAATAQGGVIDRADLAIRGKQLGVANEYERAMKGEGPSVAQAEFERNRDRNVADQMRIAALYGRGSNLGMALRQLATNTAAINNQAAADTAVLRAKEIADARTGASQALAATRGQDIDVNAKQADLTQGVNVANAGNQTDVSKLNASLATDITKTQAQIDAEAAQQNAAATNTRNIAQGGLAKDVALANQDAATKTALTQAQIDAEAAQQNAAAANDIAKTNAGFVQQTNQVNATQTNDRNATQAQLDADRAKANANLITTNNQYNATQGNNVAIKNAEFQQGANVNNQDAQVTTKGQDIQAQDNLRDAALTSQGQAITATSNLADAEAEIAKAKNAKDGAMLGGASSVGAAFAAASDRRLKKDVEPGDKALREFLDAMAGKAKEWSYAEPNATTMPPGRHVSPMAQDIEKAGPAGKGMVRNTPAGKMVDVPQGMLTFLAAVGDLHKRLKTVEAR